MPAVKSGSSGVNVLGTARKHTRTGGRDPEWSARLSTVMKTLRDVDAAERMNTALDCSGDRLEVSDRLHECLDGLEAMRLSLEDEFERLLGIEQRANADRADLARTRAELVRIRIAARQARHSAMHDELTSLPNRTCFLRRLDQELARLDPINPALAVLFIDLDGFKSVNDSNGHLIGDAFLKIIAARLARIVRSEDAMSRFGGDEFACLVNCSDHDQLTLLAGNLHAVISQPVAIDTLTLSVHASIGISICKEDFTTANELLRHADEAMYHAKRNHLGLAFHDTAVADSRAAAR